MSEGPKTFSSKYKLSRSLRSSGTGLLTVSKVRQKRDEAAFNFYAANILKKFP